MSSLAKKFADLLDPNPSFEDPEIDNDVAQLTSKYTEDDKEDDKNVSSKLRQRAAGLLSDSDKKYAGKRVSRKTLSAADASEEEDDGDLEDGDMERNDSDQMLEDDSEDSVLDQEEDEEEEKEEDSNILEQFRKRVNILRESPKKVSTKSKIQKSSAYDSDISSEDLGSGMDDLEEGEHGEEEEEEEEDDNMSPGEDSGSEESEGQDSEEEAEGGVLKFSKGSVTEEVEKGNAAKAQLGLWDSFLESRIKLQKSVHLVNQLPQPDDWNLFIQECGPEYQAALVESQKYLKKLLDQLVHLQTSLLHVNPETRALVTSKEKDIVQKSKEDSDEEITSESETEDSKPVSKKEAKSLKRKISVEDYPEFLAKRHTDFQQYRNEVIQKWYDKTRVSSGKISKGFSAFDQSALKQIEQILSDRDRLIKRTQLRRTVFTVLGKVENKTPTSNDNEEKDQMEEDSERLSHNTLKDYDPEVFDDDDFYHQLLRELIERKTTDTNDPVALSRQWLEIQKLRNKAKKRVDTKASKGRKIRHDIHKKLVNFMAPSDNTDWTDEARNELYKSLFGGGRSQPEPAKTFLDSQQQKSS